MSRQDAILRRHKRLGEDGKAVFDAIMEYDNARIALGKLLMESLKIEL